jgi:hypothetical protein
MSDPSALQQEMALFDLEACAQDHRCYRYKELNECGCNPGRLVHSGGCSNVNPLRRCASDCRTPT